MFGLLLAGLGTALLGWFVLRDRACAAFGGLLAMLSAPMMIHAAGHLELIYVGTFPLFLVAWMRFVDRPSRGEAAGGGARIHRGRDERRVFHGIRDIPRRALHRVASGTCRAAGSAALAPGPLLRGSAASLV